MGLAEELIAVTDGILKDFAPTNGTVYKRTITRVGSYQLIRRSVSVTVADTLLDPQPVFKSLTRSSKYIGRDNPNVNNSDVVFVGDFIFVISVNAITRDELYDKNTVLVIVDPDGNEEVVRLIDLVEPAVNNTDVAYIAFYRSVDRP